MQVPQPMQFAPRPGGFGGRPMFDAKQVAQMMRDAKADPTAVAAFVAQFQQFYSKPL